MPIRRAQWRPILGYPTRVSSLRQPHQVLSRGTVPSAQLNVAGCTQAVQVFLEMRLYVCEPRLPLVMVDFSGLLSSVDQYH